ncbi:MAG: hypothetical protein V4659_00265 [Pseudomonadota bacterium]
MAGGFERRPPLGFWAVVVLLTVWNAIGCWFCYMQFKLGADAMPGATDYDRALLAAMPGWYNWVYALAVGAGAIGGLVLLARSRVAKPLFVVSLAALVLQFGYLFATTDIIAHKGAATVVPFPILIALIAAFAIWFANRAILRGWAR